jgi:hypothetical protein
MEGSLVAYKVFTNGSVLQASEINDNLMRQSVMVFTNAAARTAALTSPLEGMLTWLEDVNRYESYNGTAWVIPFGTRLLVNNNFTSSTAITVDNVFSSQYDAYKVVFSATAVTAGGEPTLQLRTSGGVTINSNYQYVRTQAYLGATSVSSVTAAASAVIGRLDVAGGLIETTISNPFLAARTYALSSSVDSLNAGQTIGISHTVATSYAGFVISGSSMTGNIKVYGLEK